METIWRITAPVVPGALGLGYFLMRTTDPYLQIGARICFLFSGAWLGVVGFMWLIHTPTSWPYRAAAGAGIGIFVFVIVPLLIREAWPLENAMAQSNNTPVTGPPPTVVNQGPGSAYTSGQQGGVTIGTVNMGPERLTFSKRLGTELLNAMSEKDKPIHLHRIGNDINNIAEEIQKFLEGNGYIVGVSASAMMPNGPSYALTLEEQPEQYVLFVAPALPVR